MITLIKKQFPFRNDYQKQLHDLFLTCINRALNERKLVLILMKVRWDVIISYVDKSSWIVHFIEIYSLSTKRSQITITVRYQRNI